MTGVHELDGAHAQHLVFVVHLLLEELKLLPVLVDVLLAAEVTRPGVGAPVRRCQRLLRGGEAVPGGGASV